MSDLPSDLTKMKVVELRAELEKRDLDTKGLKADLVARLQEAVDNGASSTEEPAAPVEAEQESEAIEQPIQAETDKSEEQEDQEMIQPDQAEPAAEKASASRSRSRSPSKSRSRSKSPAQKKDKSASRSRSRSRKRSRSRSRQRQQHNDPEGSRLFVGGLESGARQDALEEEFSRFGKVLDCVIIGVKNIGYVTFEEKKDAEEAIAELHDNEIRGVGRRLTIEHAKPRGSAPKRPQYRGGNDRRDRDRGYNSRRYDDRDSYRRRDDRDRYSSRRSSHYDDRDRHSRRDDRDSYRRRDDRDDRDSYRRDRRY